MSFDRWLDTAWTRHADEPAAVAAELESPTTPSPADNGAVAALLRLSHHLHGAHLGRLAEGRAQLARLAALPAAADGARAQALAASNLCERDAVRASALLAASVATVEAAALPDTDPAVRTLATSGHNIAVALEERPARSGDERALMLQAAATSLDGWRRAGTWLHEERAHYRLAHAHRTAGDLAAGRRHAQACLAIVATHGEDALERFFGHEALGLVEAAAGDAAAHGRSLAAARAAFEHLSPDDQSWCRASLDKLAAALP